jgi:alcohol oxidase
MADPIDFDVGWLKDPQEIDVKKHVWAYKLAREMFRRMPIFRGELKGNHPNFAENSKAAVVERADGPISKGDERVEYSEEDEKALEQKIRETLSTTWHSLGTCKMAPKDQKGVVDASLNVHGLQNLKLADLSVPPEVSAFWSVLRTC